MCKLSVIVTGRNDGHLGDFNDRIETSVKANCELLDLYLGFEFEYLIIDWCSVIPLQKTPLGKIHKNVVFLEVLPEQVKGRWATDRFHQFFAKNIGIRHSGGNWILLINADNVLNKNLVIQISKAVKEDKNFFYRTRWWKNSDGKKIDCTICSESEKGLAPVYSGDFLLCSKSNLIEQGKGYDESNLNHQTLLPQAQMDGEILFNLKNNGVMPVVWDCEIFHINHKRSGIYDKEYNKTGYNNRSDWGLKDFRTVVVGKGVLRLIPKERKVERIPKNFFMAWGGSEIPVWCKKAFDEYKEVLGPHWNCELFKNLDVPKTYRLFEEQKKLPFYTFKSDIFRIWLLEEFGGIWVDTDTRPVKPFDDLLIHEGIVTVHRDAPHSSLDSFHTDSCMIGSMPNGRLLDLVIENVLEDIKINNCHQFSWNFYHTLNQKCPPYVYIGAFDEITTQEERKDFLNAKFEAIVPKRENSYIRHYLTNLYRNKEE